MADDGVKAGVCVCGGDWAARVGQRKCRAQALQAGDELKEPNSHRSKTRHQL